MKKQILSVLAVLVMAVGTEFLASDALAQNYSFPLLECDKSGGCYVTAYYDLNRNSGPVRDWNCKDKTYDNHTGTDYGIGSFAGMDANGSRPAVAAADGTVVAVSDGAYDRNTSSTYKSYCGTSTSCGNYVKLKHADGKQTIYCHMKKGSVKVSKGQTVTCGQELGRVGSSGCSTGPHLHFGVYLTSGSHDDPYAATSSSCGGQTSYWVKQGSYAGLPSYTCCSPNCSGKTCGDNGCGGSCGSCSGQNVCENNNCVCKPNCSGKACGDDGCGGSCGSCSGQNVCENSQCVCKPACDGKTCGDDGCGGSCGSCSGQDVCEGSQCVCKPACDGKMCGDDGCGGSCGECSGAQEQCMDNQCVCVPACDGKSCGDDGCGGTCGECEDGLTCEDGQCLCKSRCDEWACGTDHCGNDCGSCGDNQICNDETHQCECVPACDGKSCGDDGCGGSCGECADNETCEDGACKEPECVPDCKDKKCGDDGCGGSCGECPKDCKPSCSGRTCGDDGCGGSCGECEGELICQNGSCTEKIPGELPSVDLVSPDDCGCNQTHGPVRTPGTPAFLLMMLLLGLRRIRRRS